MLILGGATQAVNSFAGDVRDGLGKAGLKELPSKYLYDDIGSALFEAITRLPEYGLPRAEERILLEHSEAIAEHLTAARRCWGWQRPKDAPDTRGSCPP